MVNQQKTKGLISILLFFCFFTLINSTAFAKKSDFTTWNVDVVFYNGSKVKTDAEVAASVRSWVNKAESLYQRSPALKISYTIEKISRRGGKDISQLNFDSASDYTKYMDDHFDTVALTKTEGHMVVVITDSLCRGFKKNGDRNCVGGIAHFPHSVEPFSKKRGIAMLAKQDDFTYAHELGHVFGLKHTFLPYVGLKLQCNKPYKPKGSPRGYCNSCAPGKIVYNRDGEPDECNGASNVMDYCTSTTEEQFFSACQDERAANQRQTYMTSDGKVNYFKLKGIKGAPICKENSDCEAGRYCATGVATIGRNQCKELKPIGQSCTAAKQCDSGRCNTGKCKSADQCQNDNDCGANAICKLGPLGLGQNVCVATATPTCPSGWSYETRNPLKKDRCNRTTTQTSSLKCELLITDKAKNWTGPHAQSGADECRSKKGKKPKGVKCSAGYRHNIRSRADTCTKSNTEHKTPTCPSGWDYKSQSGRDICQNK